MSTYILVCTLFILKKLVLALCVNVCYYNSVVNNYNVYLRNESEKKMTTELIEMMLNDEVRKNIIDDFERNEAKALRKEILQDFEEIIYKMYSIITPKIFKTLSEEKLQNRISDSVSIEMKIERQKSTIEIYQDIKAYRKVYNL